jgi:hypothetical protein
MAVYSHPTLDPSLYPAETELQSNQSAVAWSAVWAGAVVAIGITLILLPLGSGFGLTQASAWPGLGASPREFTVGAGIWLIIMQWVSSLFGGYIAGRMRTRWQIHTDEVFFRDTAHGLLAWAVSTIAVALVAVLGSSLATAAVTPLDVSVNLQAAEAARKAAASFSIIGGLSLMVGAFIASVAAVLGGRLRDKHP